MGKFVEFQSYGYYFLPHVNQPEKNLKNLFIFPNPLLAVGKATAWFGWSLRSDTGNHFFACIWIIARKLNVFNGWFQF